MAPRDLPKPAATPKVQRTNRSIVKTNTTVKKPLGTAVTTIKKTTLATSSARKTTESTPLKAKNIAEARHRTKTVPVPVTPKSKENKSVPMPGSVTRSAKKSWMRRPKPAHSGVPVPEKMKKLLGKPLHDGDCSF